MNKYLIVPVFLFLKFAVVSISSLPLFFFDPVLAAVALYTFFHSLDTRDFVLYAFFCGLCSDIFSLTAFGTFTLSYLAAAFSVAFVSRIVYRQNWVLCFPLVFLAVLLSHHFIFFLTLALPQSPRLVYGGNFLAKAFLEGLATTLLAYPLYLFSKKCLSELIA